jgi:ketosteroid isomerase-like protein
MIFSRAFFIGAATTSFISCAVITAASPAGAGTLNEIKAAMNTVEAAVMGGESPAKVAELLYAPDVVMVGEGEANATRGMKAAVEALESHWASLGPDGQKHCKLRLTDEQAVASATTYAAFLVLHCEPNPPAVKEAMDFRTLYVWKKLPQGWRVALEMWGAGKL